MFKNRNLFVYLLLFVLCFSIIGCNKIEEPKSIFEQGNTLKINTNISCKLPMYTWSNQTGAYSYDGDDIDILVWEVPLDNFFDSLGGAENLFKNEITSMDDANAIYFKYIAEALYSIYEEENEIISNSFNKEFRTKSEIDYFIISSLQGKDNKQHSVIYMYDNISNSIIEFAFTYNEENSFLVDEFLETLVVKEEIVLPQSYQTELNVWWEEKINITIYL